VPTKNAAPKAAVLTPCRTVISQDFFPENKSGGYPHCPAKAEQNIRFPKRKFVPESQESSQQGYFIITNFFPASKPNQQKKTALSTGNPL